MLIMMVSSEWTAHAWLAALLIKYMEHVYYYLGCDVIMLHCSLAIKAYVIFDASSSLTFLVSNPLRARFTNVDQISVQLN